jgi:ribosomal-protein-alanine N-acetyltransferase
MTVPDSPRLFYRKLSFEDVNDKYIGWLNDPEINRYLEIRFDKHRLETCRAFVEQMNVDSASYLFGIFDKQSHSHIGNIKLGFINSRHRRAEISFFIGDKNFHGRGLATEAVREVTRWGFVECSLRKIEAGCYEQNFASLRCLLKCGYCVEGFARSSVESEGRRMGCFRLGVLAEEFAVRV